MIKERENVIAKVELIVQTLLSILMFILALWIRYYPDNSMPGDYTEWIGFLFLIAPTWMLLIEYTGLSRMCRDERYRHLLFRYLKVVLAGCAFLLLVSLILKAEQIDIFMLGIFALLDFFVLAAYKVFFFKLMKFFRRSGLNFRQVLVIADDGSVDFIGRLLGTKDWGYRIWGIIASGDLVRSRYENEVRILPSKTKVATILDRLTIDEVFYCKGMPDRDEIVALISCCGEIGVVFRLKPGLPVCGMKSSVMVLHDTPLYIYRNIPDNYLALKLKRGFDLLFSFTVLLLIAPLGIIIAILIKLEDNGPVFFYPGTGRLAWQAVQLF